MTPTPILSVAAEQLRRSSLAPRTLEQYLQRWDRFVEWCRSQGVSSLPASSTTIANYLGTIDSALSISTLTGIVAAIKYTHKRDRLQIEGPSDVYTEVIAGFQRSHPHIVNKAVPIELELFEQTMSTMFDTLMACRDRAMLSLAFFTAFRRSEIVSLQSEHVTVLPDGNLQVILLKSKTSVLPQTLYVSRRAEEKASSCPVRAVEEWRRRARITSGPLFRRCDSTGKPSECQLSSQSFDVVLKKYFGQQYSGHSMRRGVATTMDQCGMSLPEISSRLRHKSTHTTMGYIEINRGIQAAGNMEDAFAKGKK